MEKKEIKINGKIAVEIKINGGLFWKSGEPVEDWKLDENGYIIGADGKYYERWYDDSHAVDNNPIADLNGQWVEDSVSGDLNIDKNFDYFMSNSNYYVASSYSQFKVSWSGLTHVDFLYRSYAESTYDYLVINGLDKDKFTSQPSQYTSGILAHTSGKQSTTYNTLSIDCDEGEHFIWFCYRKDGSGSVDSDRAFVGIPNNYKEGEIFEKQGKELHYEYVLSSDFIIPREGYIQFKYYKTYFSPNGLNSFTTDDYVLGEEVPATPITKNYLRFDATTNDVHIGFNNLSLVTNMEYSDGLEEMFTSFPSEGVDIQQGKSIWLRASGLSTATNERTFTTSNNVECHGDVRSLLNKTNFETALLSNNQFCGLFKNSKITTAPELNATEIPFRCYGNMFQGCTLLTTAPALPATTLRSQSYISMFQDCASLVNAPELPATAVGDYGYSSMFQGCTSLTTAPALPATTFSDYSYNAMFQDCTSLVNAPALPATSLRQKCYSSMFLGCTSLTTAPALPATNLYSSCYQNMFQGCTSLVNAPALPATTLKSQCYSNMFQGCTSLVNAPALPATTLAAYCYQYMFQGCTSLVNAPALPATTLAPSCYSNMFRGCTSLTTAPALPATNLESDCYDSMFSGCTSLVNVSGLPATTLATSCYRYMFYRCTSLVNAPALPATTLKQNCYQFMFQNCSSLVNAPELPATTLAAYCYFNMFQDCASLTTAPELPATELPDQCYDYMFQGCRNLNSVKCNLRYYKGNEITSFIGFGWLNNVSSTGIFYKNPEWSGPTSRGGDTIPTGWTIVDWTDAA